MYLMMTFLPLALYNEVEVEGGNRGRESLIMISLLVDPTYAKLLVC